jgi:hypothetical protein
MKYTSVLWALHNKLRVDKEAKDSYSRQNVNDYKRLLITSTYIKNIIRFDLGPVQQATIRTKGWRDDISFVFTLVEFTRTCLDVHSETRTGGGYAKQLRSENPSVAVTFKTKLSQTI